VLIDQFRKGGMEALEKKEFFELSIIKEHGWILALGILGKPKEVIQDFKNSILAD
jgi:hypothetical protein